MSEYYALLSSITNLVNDPLRTLDGDISIPIVTALILGIIGSTSPCQLTTNIAALAYISQESANTRNTVASAVAYLLGKVTVYSILGLLVVVIGLQLPKTAIPAVIVMRKSLGPLLILIGLLMLGVLRLNLSIGQSFGARLEQKARKSGRWGSFWLGTAFSLAFCPTLFWLFFGLLIPLSLSSGAGLVYPGIFALGTTLPLLALVGLFALGVRKLNTYIYHLKRLDSHVKWLVGAVFIIAGINETIVYWFW